MLRDILIVGDKRDFVPFMSEVFLGYMLEAAIDSRVFMDKSILLSLIPSSSSGFPALASMRSTLVPYLPPPAKVWICRHLDGYFSTRVTGLQVNRNQS